MYRGVAHRNHCKPAPQPATTANPVMIIAESPRTTHHTTGTDGTDHHLRSPHQQNLTLTPTR
jgi:hypothetical protein